MKGFSDFDELPLALGESLHGRVGRGGKIEPFEKFAGAPLHRRAIEELQAQHAAAREPGKKNIFGDREVREYVQLLVDQRHAAVDGIGRVEGQVPEAVQREGARVGLVYARENVHQGGLAGAVLAHHAKHLTGGERERHVAQHPYARECLADVGDVKEAVHCQAPASVRVRRASSRAAASITAPLTISTRKYEKPIRFRLL